jgi:hypothetical protein
MLCGRWERRWREKTFAFLGRCHFIRGQRTVHLEMGGKRTSGWE